MQRKARLKYSKNHYLSAKIVISRTFFGCWSEPGRGPMALRLPPTFPLLMEFRHWTDIILCDSRVVAIPNGVFFRYFVQAARHAAPHLTIEVILIWTCSSISSLRIHAGAALHKEVAAIGEHSTYLSGSLLSAFLDKYSIRELTLESVDLPFFNSCQN